MKKGLIIIGKQGSGKSVLAVKIASEYDIETVATIDGIQFADKKFSKNYLVSCLNKNTKVLVIDDLPIDVNWDNVFALSGKFPIGQTCKKPVNISLTKIIVVCSSSILIENLPITSIFRRRFQVMQL